MKSLIRLLPVVPLLAFPARAAHAESPTEIHLTADLDGDGRADLIVIDRASGGFRAAYQLAPGTWTWTPARATGIAGITSAAAGRWFSTGRDSLAVAAPAANRTHIVQATNQNAHPILTPVFTPALGPSAVASPDIGGGGNTAHSDLWLATVENGAPNPVFTGTVRHDGTVFTHLAQSPSTRTPTAVRTTALKTGGTQWVAFLGTAPAQQDRLTVLSLATGAPVEVLARNVPAGSAWTSGLVTAGPLHHVLTWVPGETSFLSQPVLEGPPNTFSLAPAQAFNVTPPIGQITIAASDAGPRLIITAPDGSAAEVHSFDGVNAPTFLQQLLPPPGQSLTGLLPRVGGGFHLLKGVTGSGITSLMMPYSASGGLFTPGTPSPLPDLRPAALRANVFAFSSEPFVDPAARLLARYNAPEWSSSPILVGNQLSVTRETFGGPTAGLGDKAPLPIGTVPVGTAFALTNQFGTSVAVHSLDAGDGNATAEVEISPPPGIQTRAVQVGFSPSPSNAPVFFRLDDGPWSAAPSSGILVRQTTTLTYYARHPVSQQPSPLRTATYTFTAGPFELDSDGDGVPDFVEVHLELKPLAGNDSDGDSFTDLDEILGGSPPGNSEFTPPGDFRVDENIAFKLRVAPRPIDGSNGARASAATGVRLEAHGLDGSLLTGGPSTLLATPGVIGTGLLNDNVVADDAQRLFAVITEPVFPIATVSPDKDRGREIAGLYLIPTPPPPTIAYTPGGGTLAEETAAWIAAADAAYTNQVRPTVAGNWTEIDTLTAFLIEWKVEQILVSRGLSGLSPGNLTLFGGRLGDAGRFSPEAADIADLRLRATPDLPGYDLAAMLAQTATTVANDASMATARAAATAIYRTSSANSNAAPPGTWLPPFDVLRAFVRGTPLPPPYNAAVGIAAPTLAAAQTALAALVTGLAPRPVETLTLVVGPDSFSGPCRALIDANTAETVNLFAAPGIPYQATDGFALIPGTELIVTGYTDLSGPCPGTQLEVIHVTVASFPAVPFVDADNNLLSDDWEWTFLLGPGDPFGDDDNDGISNLQEYLDCTDPLDSNSKADEAVLVQIPDLQLLIDEEGALIIEWDFPAQYADSIQWTLEASPDLIQWIPLPGAIVEETQPGQFTITLPDGIDEEQGLEFFRIVMSLTP